MEAAVDVKYRPALYRHGGMVETKNQGSPAAAASDGVIEPAGVYLECLRNHAASAGGHVVDGCGEFMPAPAASLRCAACGCHRSFHRRVSREGPPTLLPPPAIAPHLLRDGHPMRREVTPDGGVWENDNESDERSDYDDDGRPMSPLPAPEVGPCDYLAPAPHLLLSPSSATRASFSPAPAVASRQPAAARKRSRTKFSPEQKQRMRELSERVGWRLQKRDEAVVEDCCREIGVSRGVFKVWMHNNKHNFVGARRSASAASSASPVPPAAATAVVQPFSHTAAAAPPPAAVSDATPPPPFHTDFNFSHTAAAAPPPAAVSDAPPPPPFHTDFDFSHTAAPPPVAVPGPPPPPFHADFKINGSVDCYVVKTETASGGALHSS